MGIYSKQNKKSIHESVKSCALYVSNANDHYHVAKKKKNNRRNKQQKQQQEETIDGWIENGVWL